MFSRTIIMSMSPCMRSASGERTPGISRAGRRFTYWSNSRRIGTSDPHSEMWSGTVSGQPTAPKKIASWLPICCFQSSGIIRPCLTQSSAQATSNWSVLTWKPCRPANASSTCRPSGTTSWESLHRSAAVPPIGLGQDGQRYDKPQHEPHSSVPCLPVNSRSASRRRLLTRSCEKFWAGSGRGTACSIPKGRRLRH